jgi:hypothetical protein
MRSMSPCPHRVALVALVALAGCKIYGGQQNGQNGSLGFYEPNDYAADQTTSGVGFERPIALGARADAWVLSPGISSLGSATVDDPGWPGPYSRKGERRDGTRCDARRSGRR